MKAFFFKALFISQSITKKTFACFVQSFIGTMLMIHTSAAQTPVTVTISASKDNTIYEGNPANSNGAGEFFIAGTTGSPYFNRALIQFDIAASIPAGAIIQSASLQLHLAGTSYNSDPYDINLHKVNQPWGEGASNAGTQAGRGAPAVTNDATWVNTFYPSSLWAKAGGSFDTVSSASTVVNNVGFYSWSSAGIIADIQNWLNNPSANYGWLIKSNELVTFQAKRFASRENPVAANRPLLTITYIPVTDENQWTWVKGDSIINTYGVYTSNGLITPKPGSRLYAASWKDASGNFWLLGGVGYNATSSGLLNDLWKFDTQLNRWSWIKGDSVENMPGVYGTLGIPHINNKPGARAGAFNWTDNLGNFWLFGGNSPRPQFFPFRLPTYRNDLWKYNSITNMWTWMKGDSLLNQTANYGIRGIAAPGNKPGNRAFSITWKDLSGNLWLFGGNGSYTINNVYSSIWWFNDLWKFNTVTNDWTWVKGDSIPNPQIIKYGKKGVAAPGNQPGPLEQAVSWTDSSGNFWLFGGLLYNQFRNDLWKYSPVTNEWTWVFGDSTGNEPGVYGTKGISAPGNKPGGRIRSLGWTDTAGNLWLFGGAGMAATTEPGHLNDLWKFNIQSNEWVWVSGDSKINDLGVYGTNGISAPDNKPGARTGSAGWTDELGNLWLFGGYGYSFLPVPFGHYNDLWKYKITQSPSVNIISPANNTTLLAGSTVTLTAAATDTDGAINKVEFYNNGIKFLTDSTAPYTLTDTSVEAGTYMLTAMAYDNEGGSAISAPVTLTVTACTGSGNITAEGYLNITGTQVSDLTSNPAYPNNPSVTAQLNSFEYANVGNNYGGRLRGYICAPLTGNYTFYIAGDDQAGLFLSTNEDSANKALIAYNFSPVGFRAWTATATQKSAQVYLIKGARYYIETLHKESTGIDHLSVAWTLPGDVFEGPIPGNRLSPIGSTSPGIVSVSGARAFAVAMENNTSNGKGLKVTATPNPTTNYFILKTVSNSDKPLTLKVIDVLARVVETKVNFAANGIIQIGSQLPAGMYFVEVTQGEQKEKLKLIKQ